MKLQTFVFVHDQNIILDFISHNKFSEMNNLTYVFLGSGDISKIANEDNVIIARNLNINLEEYPKLTAFSGWYAIWKNNLINSEYINLFEYDVNIVDNLEHRIISIVDTEKVDVIGYIPFNVHHHSFLKNPAWSQDLINSVNRNYNINILDFINTLPSEKECSMTSNHTMSKQTFESYMLWMEKLIDDIKISPLSGHQTERSISVFYLLHKLRYKVLKGHLEHYQFDSHQTQGISQNHFKNNYEKLIK